MFDMTDAACAGEDTDLFFPDDKRNKGVVAIAKSFCDRCPIQSDCLDHAIKNEEQGIWGGTTDDERRDLRLTNRIRIPVAIR